MDDRRSIQPMMAAQHRRANKASRMPHAMLTDHHITEQSSTRPLGADQDKR
jgi:hypothetical protein